MPVHERPKVLLFVPYTDKGLICGTAYVNDLAQTDVEWIIAELDGTLVDQDTLGAAATNWNVTGLTLTAGQTYTVRIRYANSAGNSEWSEVYAATVNAGDFQLEALDVQQLPGTVNAPIPLAIAPSYAVPVETFRGLITHVAAGGQQLRRLTTERPQRRIRLQWYGLTQAQRDTVLAVIEDSLGSYNTADVRGFDFSTVPPDAPRPLDGLSFLPIEGTVLHRELNAGVFEVLIDAHEVKL